MVNTKNEPWCQSWTSGGSSVVTEVALWWGAVDSPEICCVYGHGRGVCKKSLSLPLHFAVNLKLLSENKCYWKKNKNKNKTDLQAPSLNIPNEPIWVGPRALGF